MASNSGPGWVQWINTGNMLRTTISTDQTLPSMSNEEGVACCINDIVIKDNDATPLQVMFPGHHIRPRIKYKMLITAGGSTWFGPHLFAT